MKRSKLFLSAVLLSSLLGCSTPTLIEEISSASASVAVIADPSIASYVKLGQLGITCATTPGTSSEVIDTCLTAALDNYQIAWSKATPAEELLIAVVITAIEGYINDSAASSSTLALPHAQAKVKNQAAKTPSAREFRRGFNAAAKAAGAKPI